MSAGLNPSMSAIQFDTRPATTMVGQMRSVDTGFQEHAAPAAQVQFNSVNPYTKDTNSTKGAMMTWRNTPGQIGTFMNFADGGSQTPPPQSIGA